MTTREEDFVEDVFIANTHERVLFFTNKGKVYSLKVYEIPQAGRAAKGKAIINMLNVEKDEKLQAVLLHKEFEEGKFIVMATAQGPGQKDRPDGLRQHPVQRADR